MRAVKRDMGDWAPCQTCKAVEQKCSPPAMHGVAQAGLFVLPLLLRTDLSKRGGKGRSEIVRRQLGHATVGFQLVSYKCCTRALPFPTHYKWDPVKSTHSPPPLPAGLAWPLQPTLFYLMTFGSARSPLIFPIKKACVLVKKN